jgi:hypothetical protein
MHRPPNTLNADILQTSNHGAEIAWMHLEGVVSFELVLLRPTVPVRQRRSGSESSLIRVSLKCSYSQKVSLKFGLSLNPPIQLGQDLFESPTFQLRNGVKLFF